MNVEKLTEKLENGALGLDIKTVALGHIKPFRDMMQIQFINKEKVTDRVQVGDFIRVRGLGVSSEFGLNVSWSGKVKFIWKNNLKPAEWEKIEHKIATLLC